MGWQRKIPFGYRMELSKITTVSNEADAVRKIFAMYLDGHTIIDIAAEIEASGIRYHANSAAWNKNMVKRILDNSRYIGNEDFPRIISPKDFMAVRLLDAEKQSHRIPGDEHIKPLRKNIRCSICDSKMSRHTQRGRARWVCTNKKCRETIIIADDDLRKQVDQRLYQIALSPDLLDPCTPDEQQVSPDVLRLKNELTAAFNRDTKNPEYIRSLIFALASEQYNVMPDMCLIHTLKGLQSKIAAEGISKENCDEIEQKAIRRILLGRESGVSIELINGKIISSKEEAKQ